MGNLATLAANTKKIQKRDAQEIVKKLAEDMPWAESELAKLYAHFMPQRPAKGKSGFAWVASAIAKNDQRFYLNYVFVNVDWIIGTDGHRMHRVPNINELEPGFYLHNGDKCQEEDWARFPDTDRVVPASLQRCPVDVTIADLEVREVGKVMAYIIPHPHRKTETAINKAYFDAATAGRTRVTLHIDGPMDSTLIRWENGSEAVLMPVRQ